MNLILTAGHTLAQYKIGGGTGAKLEGRDEAYETRRVVNDIITHLRFNYGIHSFTDKDDKSLSEVINWISKSFVAGDMLIDFHFNSVSNKSATGCEVLVADNATIFEKKFAKDLSAVISKTLKIKDRGLKTESDSARSKLGILSSSKISLLHNFLVEFCFISNDSDWKAYNDNYTDLVINVSKFISSYFDIQKL